MGFILSPNKMIDSTAVNESWNPILNRSSGANMSISSAAAISEFRANVRR